MKKTAYLSNSPLLIAYAVWHEIFMRVNFCGLAIFCVLRELIFAIRTDWFFLLGIIFLVIFRVFY